MFAPEDKEIVRHKNFFSPSGQASHTDSLVSVILPVRNRERCVARAISSVLAQTYRPLELIVVDDGSTDNTRRVVEGFGAPVTLLSQPSRGVYAARNLALRHARGEFMAFIDSDDAWRSDKLALQVPLMRSQVGLVFGDTIHVTEPSDVAPRTGLTSFRVAPPRRGSVADGFAWCNFVPTCTVLVRRSCLEEIGGFSEASDLSADYLAWFRIALRHELDFVNQPVAEYTVHAEGISFALDRALAARIKLFSAELAGTTDPAIRVLLQRILFNLSLNLVLAALRGRASNRSDSLALARRTARQTGPLQATSWTAAFAIDQLRTRTRRLFA